MALAGAIGALIASIIGFIILKWWDPITEYIGYPVDARRRVGDLVNVINQLREIQEVLLRRLDPHPSSEEHTVWLLRVQDLTLEAEEIKFIFDERRLYGRKANKKLRKVIDLITEGKDLLQEAQARLRSGRNAPQDGLLGMGSYKTKADAFIDDWGAHSLGFWGMRGVGKTSLLRLLRNSYAHKGKSYNVLLVGAGTVDEMQHDIAVSLGLDLIQMPSKKDEQYYHLSAAAQIFGFLKDKAFLLLLDDVRESLDLAAIGVLPLLPTQKVIFTTRSRDVCVAMGRATRRNQYHSMEMRCLNEVHAWNLFKEQVGDATIDAHPQITQLAEKIVTEFCGGLPLALCTIGRAMSTKRDAREWRNAYHLLQERCSRLQEIEEIDDEWYSNLDVIQNELKDSFLVTSA